MQGKVEQIASANKRLRVMIREEGCSYIEKKDVDIAKVKRESATWQPKVGGD